MFSTLFLLQFLIFFSYLYGIHSINVTFDPTPIRITIADLPDPFATPSVNNFAEIIPVPPDPRLSVPRGFSIKLYMSDLKRPRYLIYTPEDDILVSESVEHRISCLLDTDHDGFPDQRTTVADASNGLNLPYGMAFANGYLYVGNTNDTRRYLWEPQNCQRQISGTGEVIMTYPSDRHWTRTIAIPPSADKIYVSIGSNSDIDAEYPPLASVQQANIDGSNRTTFAYGLRNSVGLTIHPITQDLYVTVNERNDLGEDLVPDFFTRIQQDDFFGWPFAYLASHLIEPRRCLPNGTSERPDLVALTKTPDVLFPAHVAPLDMKFYTGKQFPDRYRNGAFVAIHGSGNRAIAIGHTIAFVPFDSATNRPMGYYEDFVTGFLIDPVNSITFGRPVGLLVLKDGSLIFTDDANNRTYQVQYNNSAHCYSLASIIFLIACNYLSIFIPL